MSEADRTTLRERWASEPEGKGAAAKAAAGRPATPELHTLYGVDLNRYLEDSDDEAEAARARSPTPVNEDAVAPTLKEVCLASP